MVMNSLFRADSCETATWNLITFHTGSWGDLTTNEKIRAIASDRIPSLIAWFPGISFLFIVWGVSFYKEILPFLQKNLLLQLTVLGSLLFILPHLANGNWHPDYLASVGFIWLMLISIIFANLYARIQWRKKIILQTVLVFAILLNVFGGSLLFIDLSGGIPPVEEIRMVAKVVSDNVEPDDKILALSALWVAVEADRETLPGLSMSKFSMYDGDAETARNLKQVNAQIIFEYIHQGLPKAVILTEYDLKSLRATPYYQPIVAALADQYRLEYTLPQFGHGKDMVRVYIRKD